MVKIGICKRDNTCYECENTDCWHCGDIEADCHAYKCIKENHDCMDCEANSNSEKWRNMETNRWDRMGRLTKKEAAIVMEMANNDLKVSRVADRMAYNRGTIEYHVGKIKRKTGLDPACFRDLCRLIPEAEAVLEVKDGSGRFAPIWDYYEGSYSDVFGAMLNCAVRYCIGRQTYMPGMVMDLIRPMIPNLTDKTLFCMEQDIKEANYLGSDIDKDHWIDFLELIKEEREKRR